MNFELLGLNKYQSKVLEVLIKFGELTAYEIAKYSGVPTNKVYQALNELMKMGFVVEIPSEVKRYRVVSIERIKEEIEKKIREGEIIRPRIFVYLRSTGLPDVYYMISEGQKFFLRELGLSEEKDIFPRFDDFLRNTWITRYGHPHMIIEPNTLVSNKITKKELQYILAISIMYDVLKAIREAL